MRYGSQILLLLVWSLLQTACSSHAVYTTESFGNDSPFKRRVDGDVALSCESARRALLGQGYLIEAADSGGIRARKAVKREDEPNTFIEMNVVCLAERKGSTLFATALLSTYALKKSSSAASVGLSAVGSISLPIGQSVDSLVKVSEETIEDRDFYARFFNAVTSILAEMDADEALAEAEPAIPEEPGPAMQRPASTALPVAPAPAAPPEPQQAGPATEAPAPEPVATPDHGPTDPGAEPEPAGAGVPLQAEAAAPEPVATPDHGPTDPGAEPEPAGAAVPLQAETLPDGRPESPAADQEAPPVPEESPSLPHDLF